MVSNFEIRNIEIVSVESKIIGRNASGNGSGISDGASVLAKQASYR